MVIEVYDALKSIEFTVITVNVRSSDSESESQES